MEEPNCLLDKVLKGKYYTYADFMNCSAPSSGSHGWRGILEGRELLANHLGWAIGNGTSVNVWKDHWLSTIDQKSPMGPVEEKISSLKVKDLFHNSNSVNWNKKLIREILPQYEQDILSIKPSKRGGADKQIWLKHQSGRYTTKSGYHSARENKGLEAETQHTYEL